MSKSGQRYGKGKSTTIPVPFKYRPRTVQVNSAYRSDTLEVPKEADMLKVHVEVTGAYMHNVRTTGF